MRHGWLFLVLTPLSLPWPLQAFAQQSGSAPVTDCDTFAASPYDPEKVTDGVLPANVESEKAIPACEDAVEKYPQMRRFQFQLARALHRSNPSRAAESYRKLVAEGHAPSMVNLANLLAGGQGVTQDRAESLRLIQQAADSGFPFATYDLGMVYLSGSLGVMRDRIHAAVLLRKAMNLGIAEAVAPLVNMYASGEVTIDKAEAVAVYREAAQKGDGLAYYNLAISFEKGNGVKQDKAEAVRLYRQASDKGIGAAAYNLSMLLSRSDGVKVNRQEAQKYFNRAVELGYKPTSTKWPDPAFPDWARNASQNFVKRPEGYIGMNTALLRAGSPKVQAFGDGVALDVTVLTKGGAS